MNDIHDLYTREILKVARRYARIACSTIEEGIVHCTAVSDIPLFWNSAVSSHAVDGDLSPEVAGN